MNEIELIVNGGLNIWIDFFIDEEGHGPAWILILSLCVVGPVAAFISVQDDDDAHPVTVGGVWLVWGCLGAMIIWFGGLLLPFFLFFATIVAGMGALIRLLSLLGRYIHDRVTS